MDTDEARSSRRASDVDIDDALQRRRRRDLAQWNGTLVFRESSATTGRDRLVAWRPEGTAVLYDQPIGSSLYGYGAPSWCALDAELAVVVRADVAQLDVIDRSGSLQMAIGFASDEVVAYPRRRSPSAFVALVDLGVGRGRCIREYKLDGTQRDLYLTLDLVSDLVVDDEGEWLAWCQWPSSSMPWEAASIVLGRLGSDAITTTTVPGASAPCAQPRFVGSTLYFTGETGQWWSPYRFDSGGLTRLAITGFELRPEGCDGRSWIAPVTGGVVFGLLRESRASYAVWNTDDNFLEIAGGPAYLYELVDVGDDVVALASTTASSSELFRLDGHSGQWSPLEGAVAADRECSSAVLRRTARDVPFVWRTPRERANGVKPGLVVAVHGGPTSYASFEFNWLWELFLRRGLAVATVDHRGSTSYGSEYRRCLDGHWGEFDVTDVCDVIDELVASGEVDTDAVFVRGSSAGAMTALLASAHPRVTGVVALSAVSDLRTLATSAHEYEASDVPRLVGARDINDPLYDQRSPLARANEVTHRVLIMHGTNDPIVPVAQAHNLVDALRTSGHDVTYLEFNDGHSLRDPANLRAAYEAELDFYGR